MPTARAAKKWPASCTSTSTARPRIAIPRLMPQPYLAVSAQRRRRTHGQSPHVLRTASSSHASGWQRHQVAGAAVGVDEVVEVARRRAVDACENVLDGGGDVEEADPLVEERLDGDL